jgi:hypothetical protein
MEYVAPPPGLGFEADAGAQKKVALQKEQQRLSAEREVLALENLQLAWENAMLQEQTVASGFLQDEWWLPTDPWAAAQAAEAGLRPGVVAMLHSLKNAAELNGVSGVIEYWHADSGRWVLRMSNGEEKFAKPENLVVRDASGADFYSMWGVDINGYRAMQRRGHPSRGQRVQSSGCKGSGGSCTSSFNSDASTTTAGSSARSCSGDDADAERKNPSENGPRTTIMMRNIPNNYTREMLLDLIKKSDLMTSIDLIYLPIDFQTEVGLGYAFINLVAEDRVDAFRKSFQGFSEWEVASQKVCEVVWSNPLQGLQTHIDRYRNSPVMHESVPDTYRPVLFSRGERVPFPEPTKRIRAPRLRRPGPRKSTK